MYAILVQLTPTITMNLTNGILSLSLSSNIIIRGTCVISTDQSHHFCFVYDATKQTARIFIDGSVEVIRDSVKTDILDSIKNSSIIVGAGFQGYIDQLSIVLKAKTPAEILWDATTDGYYPFDDLYYLDKGPNGINSLPMTVTLGRYDGAANCQGIEGIDSSQKFIGSFDELYVFTRELSRNEIIKILTLTSILCH